MSNCLDATGQIRTEDKTKTDDLARLRERVLKLQNLFGQVNEDVRQILISAAKIEKRAGRNEELDFGKSDEAPARSENARGPDLIPAQARKLQAGE